MLHHLVGLLVRALNAQVTGAKPLQAQLIVKAYLAREALRAAQDQSIAKIAASLGYSRDYFGVLLRVASLAPDIVSAILDGCQPCIA